MVACGAKKQEAVWRTSWIDSSGTGYDLMIGGARDGTPLVGVLSITPLEKQPRRTAWREDHSLDSPHTVRLLIDANGKPFPQREDLVLFVDDTNGPLREVAVPREDALRCYKDKVKTWDGPAFERFWSDVVRPRLKP